MRNLTTSTASVVLTLVAAVMIRAAAEEPAKPAAPDQGEVWVPTNQLKGILAKHPNAVVLSREQYETLLRDATLDRKAAPVAPRRAALTTAKYEARIVGKVAQVTATLTVQVLSEEWSQIGLAFDGVSIGAVWVDGEGAFEPGTIPTAQKDSAAAPAALLLRGRGERLITIDFTMPIALGAGLNQLHGRLPAAAASTFQLELPPGQRVESPQPIRVTRTPEATSVVAGLSPANPVLGLTWRNAGAGAMALEPLVMANGIYTIDAEKLRADFGFSIETQLGNLATAYQIAIPANAKVLQVTGDEIAKWEVADGKLKIGLQSGERSTAKFWISLEMPTLANAPSVTLALPVPRVEGLTRMEGVFSIVGDAGVTVKTVTADGTAQPTERAVDPTPFFVASYRFNTPPTAPRVFVEKMQPRFTADLDTRVEFKSEAIFIERTLTVHQEKGEIFQTALTLPAAEELLRVRNADDSEPDWRIEEGKLRIRWSERAVGKAPLVFKIQTRSEPEKWTQLGTDGLTFALGDAKIDGAETVTGYIALKADEAFRLEAEPSETLERRDGRTSPVQGDYAWFRRQDFSLKVKVAKRPSEVLASLIGYALPLEGVLDLHAQFDFQFLRSGARSVRIQVPEKLAQNFHFDGPQIAERNLVGDTWTVVFQKELTGNYALKLSAQVPLEKVGGRPASGDGPGAAEEKESRFSIAVPVITPLDVVRTSGVWAVEANTETEITFAAKGMNELDSLLAPALADYQPRHRVIGVFAWLGQSYALALTGVRHAPAAVLSSVVDRLDLDTVVSTSGVERNQATFQLRTAGAQYLDVQLPEKSRLLSLTVDDELVKPVGERADQVRVQLPAKRDVARALAVSVLYETPKGEWRATGAYAARAPKLAKEIPVLRSQWRLFLPDGFAYTGFDSNLRVEDQGADATLIASVFRGLTSLVFPVYGSVGVTSAAVVNETTPPTLEAVPASEVRESTARIQQKLERIIIPRLEFREATVRDCVESLRGKGVDIALKLDGAPPDEIAKINEARITVSLTNIPLVEALRYVTGLGNLHFQIEESRVVIIPASVYASELVTKEWAWSRQALRDESGRSVNLRDFLTAQGVQFPPGSEVRYDEARERLRMRNTHEQIDLIDGFVESGYALSPRARREKEEMDDRKRDAEVAEARRPVEMVQRKLERIIIPRLEFREATVREALEFLKKKASELDANSPAGERGVNMVLKLGDLTPPTPDFPNPADARITVSLTNIPLVEALRYVTGLANLKFKIEPYAVSIVPASVNTDVLITKEWKIRRDLIPRTPSGPLIPKPADAMKSGFGIADRESAKNWLIGNGVQFNGQASAIYIPSSSRLIVRSTQDQLDLIDTLIASGTQTSTGQRFGAVDELRVSGLLTMKLELPKVGRMIVLEGLSAADRVEFRYDDWWSRARRLWLWFVGGGLVCLLIAGQRPWWRTCWVVLVLTFFPFCVSMAAMPVCNALLAGWLVSVMLQRLAARFVFASRRKEVLA